MDDLNDVTVFDDVNGLVNGQVVAVGLLHDPPVVHVLVAVARHLRARAGVIFLSFSSTFVLSTRWV